MRGKLVVFLFGLLVTLVSAIGLAFSLNFTPTFLLVLPDNPVIYFGICTGLGVIAMIFSKSISY